jgi:YegS/Rv2252/BmrU family lipid kinase
MSRRVPRALLVYNPAAPGVRRRHARRMETIASELRRRAVLLDTLATAEPGALIERAGDLERKDYDLIIAWGGDGTVNEAGNLAARLQRPLGILPAGTENMLARELGIPRRLNEAIDLLFSGRRRRIRAGRAGDRLFFVVAGAGFDAFVCRWVGPRLKRLAGRLAYVIGAAWILCSRRLPVFSVMWDERGVGGTQMILSNVPRYAGRLRAAPLARLDSTALDLCVLRSGSPFAYLRFFTRMLLGRHTRWRGVVHLKGWSFTAASDAEVPVHVDGEPGGALPMEFGLVPGALEVLTPSGEGGSPLLHAAEPA